MRRSFKSVELYHHPEFKFNCAQAIVYKWAESDAISDHLATDFKKFGGGNAPEGKCGALYAGLHILNGNDAAQQSLLAEFQTSSTSYACREIRGANKLNCKGCVELVDNFLEKTL